MHLSCISHFTNLFLPVPRAPLLPLTHWVPFFFLWLLLPRLYRLLTLSLFRLPPRKHFYCAVAQQAGTALSYYPYLMSSDFASRMDGQDDSIKRFTYMYIIHNERHTKHTLRIGPQQKRKAMFHNAAVKILKKAAE